MSTEFLHVFIYRREISHVATIYIFISIREKCAHHRVLQALLVCVAAVHMHERSGCEYVVLNVCTAPVKPPENTLSVSCDMYCDMYCVLFSACLLPIVAIRGFILQWSASCVVPACVRRLLYLARTHAFGSVCVFWSLV